MIVFLHVPKTAGTSFRFVLENSFGMAHCHTAHTKRPVFTQADFAFARKFFPGLRSLAGHNLVDPLRLDVPDPFYITFLREPISRVISNYQDTVIRGTNRKTFEESLRAGGMMQNLHVNLMAGEPNLAKAKKFLERCDLVGVTEKFDLSLHILQRLYPQGLKPGYVRRIVARDNTIKKAIENNPAQLALAREYNQLDLELYEFAVSEVFPQLCRKAGLDPAAQVATFESETELAGLKYHAGRIYNKVYRQACKLRNRD